MFKKLASVILAVLLLALSAPAAFAEGGLFCRMMETEYADDRLPALDEAAETVSVTQTEGSVTVEICQAYYEGNRVYISYRASSLILEQDGLELGDGAYADIIAGGSTELEDGSVEGWKECIVPEDELADTQTFCFTYRIPGSEAKKVLSVTLAHNGYVQYLQGVSPDGTGPAHAILYAGKVDVKGAVILNAPEQVPGWLAWQNGEEGDGKDFVCGWNLYRNGEMVSCDLFGGAETLEDGVVFSVMYPYMDDFSGLTLVPEYSEAGEKPDEAITLEPMDPGAA
jgi:hypothetical protein